MGDRTPPPFLSYFGHVSVLILAIFWPKNVRIQRTETLDRKVLTPTSWWWSGNQIPSKVEPHPPSTSMVEDLHMQRYQCFAKLVFNAKTRFTKHWSTHGIWEKPIQNTPGVQQQGWPHQNLQGLLMRNLAKDHYKWTSSQEAQWIHCQVVSIALSSQQTFVKIKHRRQTIKWPNALEHHK